jgi:hypothetical protein
MKIDVSKAKKMGLGQYHVDYLNDVFIDTKDYFTIQVEFPVGCGPVKTDLYGPSMGDSPVPDFHKYEPLWFTAEGKGPVNHEYGNGGKITLFTMNDKIPIPYVNVSNRSTYKGVIVAGPEPGDDRVASLQAFYGGPLREPLPYANPSLDKEAHQKACLFWKTHALACPNKATQKLYDREARRIFLQQK